MLAWFDENPALYWLPFGVVFTLAVILIIRPRLGKAGSASRALSDWRWGVVIAALLLAGRWPGLFITRELSHDESQLLAGALTLRHDPVFWRSVDGDTAGPLDFFALWPVGWLHGADDYYSARVTALLLLCSALLLTHQLVAEKFGRTVARVATLPAISFEALTLNPDFLHYSTEVVPIALLAGALYLAVRASRFPGTKNPATWCTVGLCLGAVPFAKLQAAPIAAVGGLFALASAWQQSRNDGPKFAPWTLLFGAVLPAGLIGLTLSLTHEWPNAVIPYFRNNVVYVQRGNKPIGTFLLNVHAALSRRGDLFEVWLFCALLLSIAGGVIALRFRDQVRTFFLIACTFFIVSILCAVVPRRAFAHYGQFLIIPGCLVSAVALGALKEHGGKNWHPLSKKLYYVGLLSPLLLVFARLGVVQPALGKLRLYQASAKGDVAQAIQEETKSGDSLGMWGWECQYYVESQLCQATRNAYSQAEILQGPYVAFFRARYLADLRRNRPRVFIDTSAAPGYPFPIDQIAHEVSFPELGDFIRSEYTFTKTVGHTRIYVRKDSSSR